jgi:phosphoglycerate kinase (EC 2.7.2.3)
MLQNLRLISEETVEGPIEAQKDTFIVKTLAPLVDVYVNDAFATAHRSQPSLVGFPLVLPSAAGRVMEKEISALSKIFNEPDRPKVFVLGGGKVPDSLKIIENLVKKKVADKILTGGLLAEVLALAQGYQLSKENLKVIEDKGLLSQVQRAKELMPLIKDYVEIPIDFRTEEDGKVNDYPINDVHGVIKDIGERTIMKYSQEIQEAKVVVLRGPMGVIEDERFKQGSAKILKEALESKAFVIVGGGHMISVLGGMKTDPKKVHISTGGGALLLFLAGDKLPALVALSRTSTAVKA